jgi:hypothetical protein
VNSEELEISLRTEFESYLNGVLAEMRQETSDFEAKFRNEFEKHKSRIDEVFQDFSSRLENDKQIDEAFKESVVEHLRLARDEGARITAAAIAEAEDRERENSAQAVSANYSEIRDAINDISNQDSQANILKSLVNHAVQFTPRGAFFIIKNEHFVGWRVFGKEGTMDDQSVREVYFPMASETVLSEAVRSLSPVESSYGTFAEDSAYLDKLEFGQPDRMYAIPLVARGRGVAVLYADYGTEGVNVNIEALETLVRVAGLTVELLAASAGARTQAVPSQPAQYAQKAVSQTSAEQVQSESQTAQNNRFDNDYEQVQTASESYNFSGGEAGYVSEDEKYSSQETSGGSEFQSETPAENYPNYYQDHRSTDEKTEFQSEPEQEYSWNSPSNYSDNSDKTYVVEDVIVEQESPSAGYDNETSGASDDYSTVPSYRFDSPSDRFSEASDSFDEQRYESDSSQFESPNGFGEQSFETKRADAGVNYAPEPVETVSSAPSAPLKTRLSERNVDLPIEVPEEERRLHNDARRFARLLVSEIKLYNEQKVKEGRESNDLYERLREAIDRSREMYDKRVQPPVVAKFDYFNYEIINSLAEGDERKLGTDYPGANT